MITEEKANLIATEYRKNNFNKTLGLLACGYSKNYANSGRGHKLYENERIIQALKEQEDEVRVRDIVDIDYVISGLKELAERCMQAVPVLDNDSNETGEYQFNAAGAARAYDLLGKHVGAFEADNVQRQNNLALAIKQEQSIIDKAIKEGAKLALAVENAPDALAYALGNEPKEDDKEDGGENVDLPHGDN